MSMKSQLSKKMKPIVKDADFLRLQPKEQEFILQFMMTLSPKEAAEAAGYKNAAVYGSTLMKKPKIKRFLDKFRKAVYESREIDVNQLIAQINNGIQRDAADLIGENGAVEADIRKLPKRVRQQIDGIEQEYAELIGPDGEVVGRKIKTKLKLIPKAQLLRMGIDITNLTEENRGGDVAEIPWDDLVAKPIDDDFVEAELDKLEAKAPRVVKVRKVKKKKGRPK